MLQPLPCVVLLGTRRSSLLQASLSAVSGMSLVKALTGTRKAEEIKKTKDSSPSLFTVLKSSCLTPEVTLDILDFDTTAWFLRFFNLMVTVASCCY